MSPDDSTESFKMLKTFFKGCKLRYLNIFVLVILKQLFVTTNCKDVILPFLFSASICYLIWFGVIMVNVYIPCIIRHEPLRIHYLWHPLSFGTYGT